MSRSYKKTPRSGDKKDKILKKYANRRIRQDKNASDLKYRAYRKRYQSYNICDYQDVGLTFEQFYNQYLSSWYRWGQDFGEPYPTIEKAKKNYYRWFIRK